MTAVRYVVRTATYNGGTRNLKATSGNADVLAAKESARPSIMAAFLFVDAQLLTIYINGHRYWGASDAERPQPGAEPEGAVTRGEEYDQLTARRTL